MFEIADETRGYMKSCKLDKSKGGYVQGKLYYTSFLRTMNVINGCICILFATDQVYCLLFKKEKFSKTVHKFFLWLDDCMC